jgi:hypothetical protein
MRIGGVLGMGILFYLTIDSCLDRFAIIDRGGWLRRSRRFGAETRMGVRVSGLRLK